MIKQATTPRDLEIDPITIYILKLHKLRYLDEYISFSKGVSLLKKHENQATTPKVLEIDPHNHIYSETYGGGQLDRVKGISLLKVQEKQATPRDLEIDPHNQIYSETT